jgi:hypothetical protein
MAKTKRLGEAQNKRLREWKAWLDIFKKQTPTKFTYIPNAALLLNYLYWTLVEDYLRPLFKPDEDGTQHFSPYMIISAIEITVMMTEPVVYLTESQKEKRLNASLALFIAMQIMECWDFGEKTKVGPKELLEVSLYKESMGQGQKYPVSFAAQHLTWLEHLNVAVEKPILLNAQCWRLFHLASLSVASKGKLPK